MVVTARVHDVTASASGVAVLTHRSSLSLRLTLETIVLILFAGSGFSALIYQSIWASYLGLVLGHAAYAQALVLCVFMGGMAIGAWWAGRFCNSALNLLRAYAVIEILIGLMGCAFHPTFVVYSEFSQGLMIPLLPQGAQALWQWTSASSLIVLQSIMLGATFPLLSVFCMRTVRHPPARLLGGLYYSNALGAAAGALASAFVLLPRLGMPGALLTAGLLNVGVGVAAYALAARGERGPAPGRADSAGANAKQLPTRRLLFLASAFTAASAAASFVYEIVWIRLLNQALGTTLHSFEVMLASFIFGIAAGGLWIRSRSSRIVDPVRYLGYIQVWMGLAAILSLVAYAYSFQASAFLVSSIARTDGGYWLLTLATAGIALLVMFPAAFFAGMTLPLLTAAVLQRGVGDQSVGVLYAANTLGTILGVIAGVHLLIPYIGLQGALVVAASVDIVLGFLLLSKTASDERVVALARASTLLVGALIIAASLARVDPRHQLSDTYRSGRVLGSDEIVVLYLRDGKTATVGVAAFPSWGYTGIATNGKSDAALASSLDAPPQGDEVTMTIAGLLPSLTEPPARRVAIIGWGSGLTTHMVLGANDVEQVETIEIEPAMHEGAQLFYPRVFRAYSDPRSQVVFDDARSQFARHRGDYDAVVSIPSNPWVAGVANLFTREFYATAAGSLADDGLFVQWISAYDMDDRMLAGVVAALLAVFPHVEALYPDTSDILFVASRAPIELSRFPALDDPQFSQELERVGASSLADISVRNLASTEALKQYARLFGTEPLSDYHPKLAIEGPMHRFVGRRSVFLQQLLGAGVPILDLLDGRRAVSRTSAKLSRAAGGIAAQHFLAGEAVDALVTGSASESLQRRRPDLAASLARLRQASSDTMRPEGEPQWMADLAVAATATIGHLPASDLRQAWIDPAWIQVDPAGFQGSVMAAFSAAARRDPGAMKSVATRLLSGSHGQRLSPELRDQMIMIGLVGAIASGDTELIFTLRELAAFAHAHPSPFQHILRYVANWSRIRAVEGSSDDPWNPSRG